MEYQAYDADGWDRVAEQGIWLKDLLSEPVSGLVDNAGMPGSLQSAIDNTTAAMLRTGGSFKWAASGPDGFGAGVAEMDFGVAPPILDALAGPGARSILSYLPPSQEKELALECAAFQKRRFGWDVDPDLVRIVPDVIKAYEITVTHFSRPGSPIIVPTPAYTPFLTVPHLLGRQVIQVPMREKAGFFTLDLDGIDQAFRAGADLLVLCNPHNPVGRVFTLSEMTRLTSVVDRYGGRVLADEIHAPLVYPGSTHLPYASTSDTAAAHTLTTTSAGKAWNLAGLKCAEVILSDDADRRRWERTGPFVPQGASTPGVIAGIAAFRHGEPWLQDVLAYLDRSRHLLTGLVDRHLPQVRYRVPDGTYLAWLDCGEAARAQPIGELLSERARITVVDGAAFGTAGGGAFRLNFATPQPVLTEIIERMATALNGQCA